MGPACSHIKQWPNPGILHFMLSNSTCGKYISSKQLIKIKASIEPICIIHKLYGVSPVLHDGLHQNTIRKDQGEISVSHVPKTSKTSLTNKRDTTFWRVTSYKQLTCFSISLRRERWGCSSNVLSNVTRGLLPLRWLPVNLNSSIVWTFWTKNL